jgi:hypothetical protein
VSTARAEPPPPPDSDPVLVETAAPGFADQGVAKTDVVVDEDGDAANDFILADPDPDISRSAPTSARRDEGEDSRGGPSQTSPSLFQKKKNALRSRVRVVRAGRLRAAGRAAARVGER